MRPDAIVEPQIAYQMSLSVTGCGITDWTSTNNSVISLAVDSIGYGFGSSIHRLRIVPIRRKGATWSNRFVVECEAAVAVSFQQEHPKDSVAFVFLRQPDGTYLSADVSGVRAGLRQSWSFFTSGR